MSISQGFAIIEHCLSPSECDHLIAHTDAFAVAGTRCLLNNTWCQELAQSLRQRVAAVLPELKQLVAVQCTFFNKSPQRNWFVAFHQDLGIPAEPVDPDSKWPGLSQKEGMTFIHGPDDVMAHTVALRLHLDESALDNGPLRVIPGTHKSGTLSAAAVRESIATSSDRPLTVSKGGVIAMRPLLLHASSKSQTTANRRVLHFLFCPRSLPDGLRWRLAV